jgi:hypothetical protein
MLGNCINPLNSQLAMTAVTINLNPIIKLTDDQFYHLCRVNPDVKFERNAEGEIIIVSPTGGETGKSNADLPLILSFGMTSSTWRSLRLFNMFPTS